MKKLLLSLAAVLAVLSAYADTWTYNVTNDYDAPSWLAMMKNKSGDVTATATTGDSPLTKLNWTHTITPSATPQKSGETPKGVVVGSASKPITDATFKTSGFSGKKITKVEITIASNSKKCRYDVSMSYGGFSENKKDVIYQNNSGTASTPGTAEFTPDVEGTELSFSVKSTGTTTNTKGAFKFCSITVTYESVSTGKQPCGLSLTPADVAYSINLGDSFTAPDLSNPNNLAVTWTSSKPEVASVDASTGAVTLGTVADTTRITATTEGDETHDGGSVYYDLTVVDPNAPGTVNNPYTVAQALEACASKPTGVYVKGVVVSASEWSTKYNNVDYYIADDASADASAQLNVFRGIWDSEVTNAPSDKTPEVGATVIVYGDLSVYNNTKNQVNAGNKIVSYTAPAPVIKPLGEVTYTFGEAVDQVAASATIDVKVGDKVTFKAENASKMIVSNINSGAELATADAAEVNYTIVDGVTGLSVKAIGVNSEGNEDSKIATVTLNIIKPQLGELVVKYGDKTVPADGTVSTVSVEEGTSFTLSAENATLITVEYGEDVNETFTTLPAVWKPSKHAEEIVTITANLGTDTKELKFFLTVTERQAIETENEEMVYEITPESISGLAQLQHG